MPNMKNLLHSREKHYRTTNKVQGQIEHKKDRQQRQAIQHKLKNQEHEYKEAMKTKNPNEYAFQMEKYLETGILGAITGKQTFKNENDQIPQIKLDSEIIKLQKQIQQLTSEIYITIDQEKQQQIRNQIQEIKQKQEIIQKEIDRRNQEKFQQKLNKNGQKTKSDGSNQYTCQRLRRQR